MARVNMFVESGVSTIQIMLERHADVIFTDAVVEAVKEAARKFVADNAEKLLASIDKDELRKLVAAELAKRMQISMTPGTY